MLFSAAPDPRRLHQYHPGVCMVIVTKEDLIESVADALQYEPHEPVDLVVLSYLQVGPEQRGRILRNASGWLRPGGALFVIAHDKSNVADGYAGPPSAEVCYDVDETRATLTGLDIGVAGVVERPVETEDGMRVALDALVMATRPR